VTRQKREQGGGAAAANMPTPPATTPKAKQGKVTGSSHDPATCFLYLGALERRRGLARVAATRSAGLTAEDRLLEGRLRDVLREADDLGMAAAPVCERLHALFLSPIFPAEEDNR